jgi:hypothetical protein
MCAHHDDEGWEAGGSGNEAFESCVSFCLWLGGWRSVLAGSWANKMGLSCACPPSVSRVRAGKSASGKAS